MNLKVQKRLRLGLTLVEVLIATTLTLLLMLSLAQGFKVLSESVSEGRTRLGLSDQLRSLSNLIRIDMERCTVDGKTPQPYPGNGYFKYYDGPIWDATVIAANVTSPTSLLSTKWGDIDDIVMFTAKAKSGDVFRGTVPKALMAINQLNQFERQGLFPGSGIAMVDNFIAPIQSGGSAWWQQAWTTEVTIESEFAEIIWFMMPLAEGNRLPIPIPYVGAFIPFSIEQTIIDNASVDGTPGVTDGMPDRIALCRRVQLIRGDIDLNPYPMNSIFRDLIQAGIQHPLAPRLLPGQNPATAKFVMNQFYQRCDLSLSPHIWERTEISGNVRPAYVKCNSLYDLQLPENRFAHFTYPISINGGGNSDATFLPMLALTDETGAPNFNMSTRLTLNWAVGVNWSPTGNPADDPIMIARGFIPPCFMRSRLTANSAGDFIFQPTLAEIVATNVTAFDVKAFDPAAKLLAHEGVDAIQGDVTTATGIPGLVGTDDVVVSPSDPGYGSIIGRYAIMTPPPPPPVIASIGTYVDMGWGFKVLSHYDVAGLNETQRPRISEYVRGEASGVVSLTNTNSPLYNRDPANVSGGALTRLPGAIPRFVYQPNFDTYTNHYDLDREKFDFVGTFPAYRNGLRRFGFFSPPGIPDFTGNGVHNLPVSRESIPPAPYELPSIKVTVRVQDVSAGALQQISVVHGMTNL